MKQPDFDKIIFDESAPISDDVWGNLIIGGSEKKKENSLPPQRHTKEKKCAD